MYLQTVITQNEVSKSGVIFIVLSAATTGMRTSPPPLLRRLSSPSQRRATPRSAGLQAAPARPPRHAGQPASAGGRRGVKSA
jgi:hypothetical protein